MKHRVFTLCSALSLLLCLAASLLWFRSRRTTDVLSHFDTRLWQFAASDGRLYFQSVGPIQRTDEAETEAPPPPLDPRNRLMRYNDMPGRYIDLVPQHEQTFNRFRLPAERSPGWRWMNEPVRADVPRLFVDPAARSRPAPGRWPGGREAAWRFDLTQSVRIDPKLGTYHGQITEQWLIGQTIWVPIWMIVAASAVLPAFWVVRRMIRRRRARLALKENRCPVCGYDLRVTPDQCPECGHVPHQLTHPEATA